MVFSAAQDFGWLKKYRHNVEYGSARWGTAKDIEPFIAPKFEDNVILTKTERLMMSNRPKNPANARNKNVLIIGGSGSGKTRFWLKPNLLQMHSSYVVTDPKGSIVIECGNALGYIWTMFWSETLLYSDLQLPEESRPIGRWGRMHREYLQSIVPTGTMMLLSRKAVDISCRSG